ncbi:MAG: alkaline phosphatase [Bacteroidota bacterium]
MKKILFIVTVAMFMVAQSCQVSNTRETSEVKPKNIILFIGDGMGATHAQAAMIANNNHLNLEKCTIIGMSKTSSSDKYITDSAAGATAIACGVKTYNGAIGVNAEKQKVKSVLEYAEEADLATGLVVTSYVTHATPASFIAHVDTRNDKKAIAKDFLDVDIDLFIGGGLNDFIEREDGLNIVELLKEKDYQIALKLEELDNYNNGKIAGLLSGGSMPSVLDGRGDMLTKSTIKAIDILNQNENGFFLMVEGSQIDWGAHDNDIESTVSETLDMDNALGKAIEFAEKDGSTLVIVTADHETGGLTILGEDIMSDSTATNFSTGSHTPIMVPVYAYGPQAESFGGIYENTQLFYKMMDALGLSFN